MTKYPTEALAGDGTFPTGREWTSSSSEETTAAAMDPSGCSSRHFATAAAMGGGQLRIGLPAPSYCNSSTETDNFCGCFSVKKSVKTAHMPPTQHLSALR